MGGMQGQRQQMGGSGMNMMGMGGGMRNDGRWAVMGMGGSMMGMGGGMHGNDGHGRHANDGSWAAACR